MIRREVTPEGLILIRAASRIELHDMAGNIVEGRDTTEAEKLEHAAWEGALAPAERLKRPARLDDPNAHGPVRRTPKGIK